MRRILPGSTATDSCGPGFESARYRAARFHFDISFTRNTTAAIHEIHGRLAHLTTGPVPFVIPLPGSI
jgi:hypothetical protein